MNPLMKTGAERIRAMRQFLGLSQAELQAATGVPVQVISAIENSAAEKLENHLKLSMASEAATLAQRLQQSPTASSPPAAVAA